MASEKGPTESLSICVATCFFLPPSPFYRRLKRCCSVARHGRAKKNPVDPARRISSIKRRRGRRQHIFPTARDKRLFSARSNLVSKMSDGQDGHQSSSRLGSESQANAIDAPVRVPGTPQLIGIRPHRIVSPPAATTMPIGPRFAR